MTGLRAGGRLRGARILGTAAVLLAGGVGALFARTPPPGAAAGAVAPPTAAPTRSAPSVATAPLTTAPTSGASTREPAGAAPVPVAVPAAADTPAAGTPAAGTTAVPAIPAGSILAGLPAGPAPRPAVVAAAVAALVPGPVLGRRIGVLVVDPYTGASVLSRLATVPLTPASTSKLLTATALVDRFGAGYRFQTRAVLQPAPAGAAAGAPGELVLVGGGDPSLTSVVAAQPGPVPAWSTAVREPARLPALALATATALHVRGVLAVRVDVDDALFSGPRVNPAWPGTDVPEGFVGPVDALAVDNGRVRPGSGIRVGDPARAAGARFAALLRADGIIVTGPVVRSAPAAGAPVVAAVSSPPVAELVRHMLENSDNDYAEVLSRQVAVGSADPATFAGGVSAVDDRLAALGIDLAGSLRFDGSGLSHLDRIEPATLAAVVALDLRTPGLAAVLEGTAVSGRPGSLLYRMGGARGPAAGRVVAKTGTLTRVHALVGYVLPPGGRPLIFVFMGDSAHDDLAAEDLLDDAAVRLAAAGPGS